MPMPAGSPSISHAPITGCTVPSNPSNDGSSQSCCTTYRPSAPYSDGFSLIVTPSRTSVTEPPSRPQTGFLAYDVSIAADDDSAKYEGSRYFPRSGSSPNSFHSTGRIALLP